MNAPKRSRADSGSWLGEGGLALALVLGGGYLGLVVQALMESDDEAPLWARV